MLEGPCFCCKKAGHLYHIGDIGIPQSDNPSRSLQVQEELVYVACCGTSIQPVLQMLEQVPQLDTVLLCLDNDEAGNQASRRMQNQLEVRYSVERLIPESKDWNDDLTLSSENAQGLAMNEMR